MSDIAEFHAKAHRIAETMSKSQISKLIQDSLARQKAATEARELAAATEAVQVGYCALKIAEAPKDPRRAAGRAFRTKTQDDRDAARESKKGTKAEAAEV